MLIPHGPMQMSAHCFNCCSVAQSCLTLATPWIAAQQASLSFTISQGLLKLMSIESVMPSYRLILCCPFVLIAIAKFTPPGLVIPLTLRIWTISF